MKDIIKDQQEFFEEFKNPRRGIGKIRERYASRKRPLITISLENFVLSLIAIIMVIVIFFSLGVERGRRIGKTGFKKAGQDIKVLAKEIVPVEPAEETKTPDKPDRPEPQAMTPDTGVTKPYVSEPKDIQAKYTIQIVTYRDEKAANKRIETLKKEGLTAFIIPKDGLFQVCIGKYSARNEANSDLKKFKKQYNDCFVRNVE